MMMHLYGEDQVQGTEILEAYAFDDDMMATYSQALGDNFHVLMRLTPVNAGEEEK